LRLSNGIDEDPAKIGLCLAISDHKINFRGLVGKVESLREYTYADSSSLVVGTLRESYECDIPLHLTPHDFDWPQSRPVKPWPRQRSFRPYFPALEPAEFGPHGKNSMMRIGLREK
jgi:hypothetical protein